MKMEIELTDAQAEKVEILKENGVSVGEAIDRLFEMKYEISETSDKYIDERIEQANKQKAELEEKMAAVDEELSVFNKIKETPMNPDQKIKIIADEYGTKDKTYDETVHDKKLKFSWSKFIKF
jgi:hypothetical protein